MKLNATAILTMVFNLSACGVASLENAESSGAKINLPTNTQSLAIVLDTPEVRSDGGKDKLEKPDTANASQKTDARMDLIKGIRGELAVLIRENKAKLTEKKVKETFNQGIRVTDELRAFSKKLAELEKKGEDTKILTIRFQVKAADLYTVIGLLVTDLSPSPANAARLKSLETKVTVLIGE